MTKLSFARRFALSSTILAVFVSFARATPETDFETRREQEGRNFQTMAGSMPLLDVHRAADVFRLNIENKVLVLRTSLPSTSGAPYARVALADGKTALVHVQKSSSSSDHSPSVPAVFQFTSTDYSHPLQISTLAISAQPNYCSISLTGQFPGGGFSTISLVQQNDRFVGLGASVHLTVNEWNRENNSPVTVELQAADYPTLVRQHARECDQYLRPLLRDLGQEAIFAPDPLIAWEVFADLLKPAPEVAEQVQKLLPLLDADDFHRRARASAALEKLGRSGATVLLHLDRKSLTPEQNSRIDVALLPYSQISRGEAARLRSSPSFLLDCLYSDDAWLRTTALSCLREVSGGAIDFDPNASDAGRYDRIEQLRTRLAPAR